MAHRSAAQLNIRSAFARARVSEITRETGMTATEVVEDALRAYVPPSALPPVGTLERRGPLLVRPVRGPERVTLEEAEAALDASRERDEA